MLVSATLCLGAYALWLWSASAALSVPLLALVGLGTGPLHPLAEARAYAAHPDRPGVVAALASLFTPLEVLAPLAIGAVANHWGLVPALALLALQPIGFLVFALSRAGAEPTSR